MAKATAQQSSKAKVSSKAKAKATKVAAYIKEMSARGFTRCPVCVSGTGMYKDIAAHNRKQHGGRTPKSQRKES